jgi:sec-independent protein translocase protein TatB
VFGLGFGEFCVLVIVAIVVIGPKDMPRVLRKAGQLAGRIRRMASDVRAQSGIDEVLRADGLQDDIAEIQRLARADFLSPSPRPFEGGYGTPTAAEMAFTREREYPRDGADSYGANPDGAILYAPATAPSALAGDRLYVDGDAEAAEPPAPLSDGATAS